MSYSLLCLNKTHPLTLGIVAVLYCQNSLAEVSLPSTTLQTITVLADRYQNDAQQAAVSQDDHTLVRQADLLSNYLATVPGVTVGGTSGLDQNIYIRGIGADNAGTALKITVDGVRQPETRGFHHMGIVGLDPALYKKTEVEVGNNSVTLGNNAIGGAVAFTTVDAEDLLRPDEHVGARVKLGYASNDAQVHGMATIYGKPSDKSDVLVSYAERQSDGGEDGRGLHIQGDDITIKNILAKASLTPSLGHRFSASYQSYDDRGLYPFRPNIGYQANLKTGNIFPGYNKNQTYAIGYDYTRLQDFTLAAKAYHMTNESEVQGIRNNVKMRIATQGKTDGLTLNAHQKITQSASLTSDKVFNHLLSYGIDGYRKATTLRSNQRTEAATSIGIYAQDRIEQGRFALTPGLRYDYYQPSKSLVHDDYHQLSSALAGEVMITDNSQLFASYTQLFNGPPLPETLYNGASLFSNGNLKAETGSNKEVGFSHSLHDLLASQDNVMLTAKFFHTDYDNKINRLTGYDCRTGQASMNGGCATFVNAGKTTYTGYEIAGQYQLDDLSINAGYSQAKSKTAQGYNLAKDSGDQFTVAVDYQISPQLVVATNIRHMASLQRRISPTVVNVLPSFTTIDLTSRYQPKKLSNFSVDAGIYNLTDAAYVEHTSNTEDYSLGRNIKVALNYQF